MTIYIGYVRTLPDGYDVFAINLGDSKEWFYTCSLDRPLCWDDATWWTLEHAIEQGWCERDDQPKRDVWHGRSWKFEVVADDSGEWCSNARRFATKAQAERAGNDLYNRWTSVREWRVVETDDPVTEK